MSKITLAPESEAIVNRFIASGRFESPEAVLREAFRQLDEYDNIHEGEMREQNPTNSQQTGGDQ